jgi:hypothetical protein
VQVVGAAVTIAGLLVVAPKEAGRVFPAMLAWAKRWLTGRRRQQIERNEPVGITDQVMWTLGGEGSLRAVGTTEDQLAMIRGQLQEVRKELDQVKVDSQAIRAEMKEGLGKIAEDHDALKALQEQRQREQGQLNAKGFPLAAVGALLSGFPGLWLADWPTWVSVVLLVVGGVTLLVAGRWLRESGPQFVEGLHSFQSAKD